MIVAPAAVVDASNWSACPTSATRSTWQAFRSFAIPDDRNAYVLYRQAADRFKPVNLAMPASLVDSMTRWSKTDPEFRRWVEENREAMALFRRGTERPDALVLDCRRRSGDSQVMSALTSFFMLALLEASRLEEQGDMAGAWGWYRAALRATYHMGLRGRADARLSAHCWHGQLASDWRTWAADRRTTPALIRQALDEAVACGALAPSESYTLKAEYLLVEPLLNGPDSAGRQDADRQAQRQSSGGCRTDGHGSGPGDLPMPGDSGVGSRSGAGG